MSAAVADVLEVGSTKAHLTIGSALAVAQDGDELHLDPEVFTEASLTLSVPNLTLKGVGPGYAVIRGASSDAALTVETIVLLQNLELDGQTQRRGLNVRVGGDAVLQDCWVHAGSGTNGAGARVVGDLTVQDSLFTDNAATGDGGHIHADNLSDLVVSGATFTGGSADRGGAINCIDATTCEIADSHFEANAATTRGGAIRNHDLGVQNITSSTFCGNSAPLGGAISFFQGDPTLLNNLFLDNVASDEGGAIYAFNFTAFATNNHFVNNTGTTNGAAVRVRDSNFASVNNLYLDHAGNDRTVRAFNSTVTFNYDLFWNNATANGDHNGTEEVGVITAVDPQLTYTPGTCDLAGMVPPSTSILLGSGDPSLTNVDGSSPSDIGAFGGSGTCTQTAWYLDGDNDGYGDPATEVFACTQPPDHVATAGDCLDSDANVNPGGTEVCDPNDVDEDCNGVPEDAAATGQTSWYLDDDDDGFGAGTPVVACDPPLDHVSTSTDCDDGDQDVNPGASELECNGIDDDCDPLTPDSADTDNDGVDSCSDCDDSDPNAFPGATEICDPNDVDEDCDGSADGPTALGQTVWHADLDGDGFGNPNGQRSACDPPPDHVADDTDCDDIEPLVNPDATEVACNGEDDDCDPATLDGVDADGDGVSECTDCDDADDQVFPGGTEICDDLDRDEDCDGTADGPAAAGQTSWYRDDDGDGFGDSRHERMACDPPAGHVEPAGDCDDTDDQIHPDGAEVCDDADVDEDCDGLADDADPDVVGQQSLHADLDGDGFGGSVAVLTCEEAAPNADDCDDTDSSVNPDAAERCDGFDNDCDSLIDDEDDDLVGGVAGFRDADGDGYGTEAIVACAVAATDGDCDDTRADVNPGADDVVGDEVDQDCSGIAASASLTGGGGGCGCSSTPPSVGALTGLALVLAAGARRRRRR